MAIHQPRSASYHLQPMPQVEDVIADSWRRCQVSGLDQEARPEATLLGHAELRARQDAAAPLLLASRPQLQSLHAQVASVGHVAVVCDTDGMILDTLGDAHFLRDAERMALRPGACWSEHARGTNAIGTGLAMHGAVRVHAAEHYMRRHHRLSCAAAPVYGPTGQLLGLIDVSGPPDRAPDDVLARVCAASAIATQQCFAAAHPDATIVAIHADARQLALPQARLLAINRDGQVLGVSGEAAHDPALAALMATFSREGADRWLHALRRSSTNARTPDEAFHAKLVRPAHSMRQAVAQSTIVPSTRATTPARTPSQVPDASRTDADGPPLPDQDHPPVCSDRAPTTQKSSPPARHDPGFLPGVPARHFDIALRLLAADIPVLLQGETGTGKEVFARWLHSNGPLAEAPFVAINCAAVPENLIEAELFGYEEGAFTGARRKGMPGRLMEADGGILFLDEIGDMPPGLQTRLLRVLQDRVVTPLGGGRARPAHFRLLCATHRDLDAQVAAGEFRADLLYRINHFPLALPALRERDGLRDIIQNIADHHGAHRRGIRLLPALVDALASYAWPGNMRQLDNLFATLMALADDGATLDLDALPAPLRNALAADLVQDDAPDCPALIRRHGSASAAARAMGWSRSTFYRRWRAQSER